MPKKTTSSKLPKILIIEDDAFLRDLATNKLKREGFAVFGVSDSIKGFETLKKESIDLILLDIILPGIDGFEILRRVKTDENFKHIPVILLSNLGQKSDIDRGLSLGAAGYMVKAHHTLDEIIEKIKNTLKKKS